MTTANEELRERIMVTILGNESLAKGPISDIHLIANTAFDWVIGVQKKPLPEPAVPINKSITPDYLICLDDGKKLKMLKRHLHTAYGLTPDQYRQRWGLPGNYPMTSPNYTKHRSKLAKKIGLGSRPKSKS